LTGGASSDTMGVVRAPIVYFAVFAASIVSAIACGARTGLDVPPPPTVDAGVDHVDAPPDVVDAPPDVVDAPPDVPIVSDCEDAGTTYIYVITEENDLYGYYPPSNSFHPIGTIQCPTPKTNTPFSMAVDRKGTAYVVFSPSGELFQVSTADASCKPTGFVSQQGGFNPTFGMGYSADLNDPGETLFVAGDGTATDPQRLATIDTTTFQLSVVGPFSQTIGNAELTGTGDGRLYAYGVGTGVVNLAQIDKTSANVLSNVELQLPTGDNIDAWAFAFWGGNFYFFSSSQPGSSDVSVYTPGGSTSTTLLTTLGNTIVGAGVSTCAPLH
jgi:hypothetical protein